MDLNVNRYLVPSRTLCLGALALLSFGLARAQGVVNAPVAPDTIYVGRVGVNHGISVIDLNGFGQSTGDPTFDPTFLTFGEGRTNFPNNPNVRLQGSLLRPPLAPGTSTLDGGSAGVFTLTKSSELRDILITSPDLQSVGDMMLGAPLDLAFDDAPAPFGCQSGGGQLCAIDGLQVVDVAWNGGHGLLPTSLGAGPSIQVAIGLGNPISFAPCPNPPPIITPPLCAVPLLSGQQPTSIDTPTTAGIMNLLGPGDPLGDPLHGIPPTGLLATEQNGFFVGPSIEQQTIAGCQPYQMRQQIGHFLYVVDNVAHQVVVLNSNTFTVIARIALDDPTELAMSPDLKWLAVTNRAFDKVSFIDIDPHSATFHQVASETMVGSGPSGIAWDPGNEDVLVCNEAGSTVSILSASSLQVRNTLRVRTDHPFAVAVTQRQRMFGWQRNLYYAYILNRSGRVSLYESGPHTINGWGYDALIGITPPVFTHPTAIQVDRSRPESGVWITHEGQLDAHGQPTGVGGGAVTNLVLHSTHLGTPGFTVGDFLMPHMRDLTFEYPRSIGSDQLTGLPLDLAFDDQVNLGALPDYPEPGAAALAPINGKGLMRDVPGVGALATNVPHYMFVTVRSPGSQLPGRIDVIDLASGLRKDVNAFHAGTQSIEARGATVVMDYFRE